MDGSELIECARQLAEELKRLPAEFSASGEYVRGTKAGEFSSRSAGTGTAHATEGGPFAVMESSEASLALIARTEVADRRNATCHDGRA